jgi:hypothetical protein
VDGKVVSADGVRKEFDIAHAQGLVLLPVGATGYMAHTLWEEVMADYAKYYPTAPAEFRPMLEKLGDESLPLPAPSIPLS